jgi:quinol monooxygenase YgiN
MNTMSAVAIFPSIAPENLEEFKALAAEMLKVIQKQDSILRYDMFFNHDSTRCVVLEEYSDPAGVIEHVEKNSEILAKLIALGGAIDGSVFPMNQEGEALAEIRAGWDTKIHSHFSGKK